MTYPADLALATPARPSTNAHQRELRRSRIMGFVRSGYSYDEIARREQLSRERIRQIVRETLDTGPVPSAVDNARIQMARLEPALRLAASAVENGELGGVAALLRVLERLDKYAATTEATQKDYAEIHERLMRKMNIEAEKLDQPGRAEVAGLAEGSENEEPESSAESDNADEDELG